MSNGHELSPTVNEQISVEPIDLPAAITELSPLRRIVKAGWNLGHDIGKIVLSGNTVDAVRESANHF